MIKILHFGLSKNIGGIETYLLNTFEQIKHLDVTFNFATYSIETLTFENRFSSEGCTFVRFKHRAKRIFVFKSIKELTHFFRYNQYDVVELHVVDLYDITPILASKISGIKNCIIHSHSSNYYGTPSPFVKLRCFFNKILLRFIHVNLVGCSQDSLNFTFGKNVKGNVVLNGIDINRFSFDKSKRVKTRSDLAIQNNTIVWLNVGRLCIEKNQEFIVELFNLYHSMNSNSVLLFAGEGPCRNSLSKKVSFYGLNDCVYFMGNIKETENLYSAADIFLFPSVSEGFGISLIEAESSGLVCFCSQNIPREIPENRLVKKISLETNPIVWVDMISKISIPYNRNEVFDLVGSYSIESTVDQILKIYRKFI